MALGVPCPQRTVGFVPEHVTEWQVLFSFSSLRKAVQRKEGFASSAAGLPNLKGTLFVVTYGRSGSTLLQNVLMTIPGCVIRGENHNILETLWWAKRRSVQTRDTWHREGAAPDHPWYGADRIDPHAFGEAMVAAFVQCVLQPPPDVRWLGFKEIRYNAAGDKLDEQLDFIRCHFPNAHFVFNSREAEAVSKSDWWQKWKKEDVLNLVAAMDDRFDRYAAAHPECSFRTRYEEFTADPGMLRPLFDRLGEPFDPLAIQAVLDHRLTH